ncbi:MAG: hypothetical protein KBT68_02125, partial [bacterium]|nr:hypothetical protein [Candidatus Colisoma equi]
MLKGHAERSGGWRRMFTDAGLATRDAGLKGVMERKYTWLSSQHVSEELDRQRFETGAMWLAQAHRVYSSGGKDALASTGHKTERVEALSDFNQQERMLAGSRQTPAPSASEESRVKSEKSKGRRKGRGRQKDYYRAQVDERRRERDIENWNRQEEELGRKAGELMTRFFENRENAERLIDELEPIRNIWAKGGGMIESVTEDGTKVTIDPGQTALIKAGFSKETAKEFSDIFREEQRRRCSPAAFNGIQAIYERSTRGMTTARGNLDSVLQKGRVPERDGRVFVNFTKPTGESVDVEISRGAAEFTLADMTGGAGDNMAGQVEERTKGKVKAADWAAMTPEERLETVKRYNLVQAGNFVLTDPHDPSITGETDGARRIVGRIETPAVGGKPFHEVAHGYFRFMQESGSWNEADIKWLRETFGEPRAKNELFDKDGKKVRRDELFNEEAACDGVQAYATKKLNGSLTDEPTALRKLWTFARRMVHLTERRVAEEKLAADREQALYDAILTGTFSHIADLKVAEKPVAPKPSEGGEGAAAPQTGTLPKESGRFKTVTKTPETVTKTGTEAAKPTEGAVKPEVRPEVTFEALTPTGGKKIRGHYEFVPLAKLLHSNKPGYPMELQGRDRKDNKAEQQTRNDHVANFEAGYLLADPKTDSGAMVVVKRPAEGGGVEYVVVSGNGRTMVLEDLAAKNLYDRYRNPAKAFAAENGIENGVPDGENPVLIRVIDDLGGATLKEIADLSNTNAIQQMNEEEQARADADTILKLDIARLYAANADGSPNMTPGANADFFREFVKGIGDTGMLNSDGSVTEALRLRAQRALLAI